MESLFVLFLCLLVVKFFAEKGLMSYEKDDAMRCDVRVYLFERICCLLAECTFILGTREQVGKLARSPRLKAKQVIT